MTFLDLLTDINYNAAWWTGRVDASTDHTNSVLQLHSLSSLFKAFTNSVGVFRGRQIWSAQSGSQSGRSAFPQELLDSFRYNIINVLVSTDVATQKNALAVENFWVNHIFSQVFSDCSTIDSLNREVNLEWIIFIAIWLKDIDTFDF